ncbi:hypothetical protein VU13_03115, partial [Desulfobulbus sp. US5]|nr:hypothetical protein [Desulfobulbus sp. US5]
MKNLITSTTQFVARNFKKNIVMLSVLMLGCSFFAEPVQASGDERRERSREESKIYGVIEKMPVNGFNGMWIINGKKVL